MTPRIAAPCLQHTSHFSPLRLVSLFTQPSRCLHRRPARPVPPPTPFVPDHTTFLTLIGRNMIVHRSKIPDWNALFTLTSEQLRDAGLEPARARRYLLRWREKFRNGEYGIGGDLKDVTDGVAELRIVEVRQPGKGAEPVSGHGGEDVGVGSEEGSEAHVPSLLRPARDEQDTRRMIINVPRGASDDEARRIAAGLTADTVPRLFGMKIKDWDMIAGSHMRLIKGAGRAELKAVEGLWEHKRGHKVDGGERRKAMVRAKRRAAEART